MEDQALLVLTTSDELSNKQWIVLHVLQISSASLSMLGSSTIIFKILRDRAQNVSRFTTSYDRIILCLSTFDIIASFTQAVDHFLLPRESGNIWAFGSQATCQNVGFYTQLCFVFIWYNCILSYYFLLRILSQVRRQDYVRKYELSMHLSAIYFPVIAIIGYFGGWYDDAEVGSGCWISDPVIKWVAAGIPTLFTYLSLIINNIVIYAILRKSLRSSEPAQKKLMREATTLMFLYVGCFFITVSPAFILEVLEAYFGYNNEKGNKIYPLMVLNAILRPLQGFFNVLIYIKPAYARFRAANPEKNMYFVLRQALFNPKVPRFSAIAEGDAANPNDVLFNSNYRPHAPTSLEVNPPGTILQTGGMSLDTCQDAKEEA